MGDVYRARDTKLGREVALKVLGGDGEIDAKLSARFEREALVLAALNHPNIAAIYGREDHDGRPILVLELVEGRTLTEILADGAVSLDETLHICDQVGAGLVAAHEEGIVHRDLKPSNVMVTAKGNVKILDFGIAKPAQFADSSIDTHDLTATGMLIGTVPYMSPEQVRGQELDQRSDIWAFGCLLFELLTGQKAFERETIDDTLAAIIEHEPRCELLPAATPAALQDLLSRSLAKDREERLGDVRELRREIEQLTTAPARGTDTSTVGEMGDLARARDFIEQHGCQEAFDILAPRAETLTAPDLARLSRAAWWTGNLQHCIEADERAFSMFMAESNSTEAAATALRIADHYSRRLESALANGWLARAERLLEGAPEAPVHGWVLRAQIMRADSEGRFEESLAVSRRMLEIGNRLGDRDLQALAIHYEGRTLLKQGDPKGGMALIDEATVAGDQR